MHLYEIMSKLQHTCHSYMVTANPDAAAVPANPTNIGAPTLLANMEAPTYRKYILEIQLHAVFRKCDSNR